MQWNTNGTLAEHTPEQLETVQCLAGWVLQVEHHAEEHKWNTINQASGELQCFTGWVSQVGQYTMTKRTPPPRWDITE